MTQERALVLDKASQDIRKVWVRTQRQSACDACQLKSGCGQHLMAKLTSSDSAAERSTLELEVENVLSVRPGDVVILQVPDEGILTASFIVYLLPLLSMLFGAVAFDLSAGVEWLTLLGGALGLVAGFIYVRRYSQKHKDDPRYVPVMIALAMSSRVDAACV